MTLNVADQLTVVLDASVLYPAPLRSFLMYLATSGLFRARWSDAIHEEWMRSVARNRPDIPAEKLFRVRQLMDSHVLDCLVNDFEPLVPTLTLPDANDRHVLAAAIQSGAQVIATMNLRDFPAPELSKYGIRAQHPDEMIVQLMEQFPESVVAGAKLQRASLKNPPMDSAEFLQTLEVQGLTKTVAVLQQFAAQI